MNDIIKCDCQLLIKGYDWGPSITCITLLSSEFNQTEKIDHKQFNVTINKLNLSQKIELSEATIMPGKLLLYPLQHPSFYQLSTLTYNHVTDRNSFVKTIEIVVELNNFLSLNDQVIKGFEMPKQGDYLIPIVKSFTHDVFHFDRKVDLGYSLYIPEEKISMPLIIWLHGAGEGGKDFRVALLGNPVSRLIEPEIQNCFDQAAVLLPQCPTFWMDSGDGTYTADGKTIYAKALYGLIEKISFKNRKIDKQRIYLGGCSNGGYMVINMLLQYPGYFAAGFSCLQTYYDKWLSDNDIISLKQTPLWFTHAKNDQIVPYDKFSQMTYDRLCKIGATDVRISLFDKVEDYSQTYFSKDGNPYEYHGHWSWIYCLNNQCEEVINNHRINLFSWLAKQSSNNRKAQIRFINKSIQNSFSKNGFSKDMLVS